MGDHGRMSYRCVVRLRSQQLSVLLTPLQELYNVTGAYKLTEAIHRHRSPMRRNNPTHHKNAKPTHRTHSEQHGHNGI